MFLQYMYLIFLILLLVLIISIAVKVYKNYQTNTEIDIFIAISHGQHRGTLKEFFTDDRVSIITRLTKKASYNIFG